MLHDEKGARLVNWLADFKRDEHTQSQTQSGQKNGILNNPQAVETQEAKPRPKPNPWTHTIPILEPDPEPEPKLELDPEPENPDRNLDPES